MDERIGILKIRPCLDSDEMAEKRREELSISRHDAAQLGLTAVEACQNGYYLNREGDKVDWSGQVQAACLAKISIPPDEQLPTNAQTFFEETHIQVANETTLQAARRLVNDGERPLALNFANGIHPGGGFLHGARAQEEVLCRSSSLYQTLVDDPMYEHHLNRPQPDSTSWTIYSPEVPVFREDDGTVLDTPWLLSFLTCAAPVASTIGQPTSGDLLQGRIHRVLAIAEAYQYSALILGAWGCGAFGNDPYRTAADFRRTLEEDFAGAFSKIVFAITDWSPERRYLGPFRDEFFTGENDRSDAD